jgi:50S ribosomal subunit-associated GTPase HflX
LHSCASQRASVSTRCVHCCCRGRGRSGASSGGLGGGGGAGETELQLQRRRIDARRRALRLKLGEVQRTRAVQRAGRRRSGKPLIAVVVRSSRPRQQGTSYGL